MILIAVLLGVLCRFAVAKTPLRVETENGWVKGAQNDLIYSWRGIPFAKPPVGKLRFEPPQPPDNWTDTWDATYDRSGCISLDVSDVFGSVISPQGDEDCLYINVYAPKTVRKNGKLLPVMVWIYGGVYLFGNSSYSLYGPDGLVTKDVIFVSFNYRLGIFGFICTHDDAVRCNNGMRDQIFALKWVQRNIRAFGGNPEEVTVFGQSAGAASISYFIISPAAKGYVLSGSIQEKYMNVKQCHVRGSNFSKEEELSLVLEVEKFKNIIECKATDKLSNTDKRAIMQSGSSLCVWSKAGKQRKVVIAISVALGIITSNTTKIILKLKNVPAKKLQVVSLLSMGVALSVDPINYLIYAPVIEKPGPDAIITESSYQSLSNGNFNKVPQFIGYNDAEALFFKRLIKIFSIYLALYDVTPHRLVPRSMNANLGALAAGLKIKRFYTKSIMQSLIFPNKNFLAFLTDTKFIRPIQETAWLTSKHVPVYLYRFSFSRDRKNPGAAHADELSYLFNSRHKQPEDNSIKCCIRMLFTNFAKYGDPTPSNVSACGEVKLDPTTSDDEDLNYISIDRNITVGQNPDEQSMDFWRELFDSYATPPLDTY